MNTKGTTKFSNNHKDKQPYTKNFKNTNPQEKTQIKKYIYGRKKEKLNILPNVISISVRRTPDWLSC